jgi:hypothetical protein
MDHGVVADEEDYRIRRPQTVAFFMPSKMAPGPGQVKPELCRNGEIS